jgi:tetratricopeptide (TPR) repeat protein
VTLRPALPPLFLAAFAFHLRHMAPSVSVGDSGEFITAAATLSLPHSPGYPLFVLLGKAFLALLPWAEPGYAVNVFSAACNAGSAVLAAVAARRWLGFSRGGALFTAAVLTGLPAFFHNGLVTEVFALNTLLALGVLTALAAPGARGMLFAAFLFGAGLANHQTLLFVAPAWGAAALARRLPARAWGAAALLFLLGLSLYAALLFRARQEPPLNWGRPDNAARLWRTVSRQDYGSFSLALGDAPARTAGNAARQLGRYFSAAAHEFTAAGAAVVFAGLLLLLRDRPWAGAGLLGVWFLSGPFFAWLGNLPFDGQSDGILERFHVLPAAAAVFGAGRAWDALAGRARPLRAALAALPLLLWTRSAQAYPLRGDMLAADYSRGIFRALPPGAALFMDGGDDTFYSTAFRRFARREREDLKLFDRGGLVFATAYGADFRGLPRPQKERRRGEVERAWLERGPLFYSTMNESILPGVALAPAGLLYEAGREGRRAGWEFLIFRSVYPPASGDYRTRALAPVFPYQEARALFRLGRADEALARLARAWRMGPDVPWLRSNVLQQALESGFRLLNAGDAAGAARFFALCLAVDPANAGALTNLGVAREKAGDLEGAAALYRRALESSPDDVNALYNLAVTHWRRGEWAAVIPLLERVIALKPDHPAQGYLAQARRRLEEER